METNIIEIPFDFEIAKKIQNAAYPGEIVTRDGKRVRIEPWLVKYKTYKAIVGFFRHNVDTRCMIYTQQGEAIEESDSNFDLVLQVPEWTQLKRGDVIVFDVWYKNERNHRWISLLNSNIKIDKSFFHFYVFASYKYAPSYNRGYVSYEERHEDVCSIRLATEEEKEKFIKRLQEENSSQAKEYLKRFFGIEEVEEKPEYKFEPFQQVLVRGSEKDKWECSFFSHYYNLDSEFRFFCINGLYTQCIPYNDATKHLVGTTDNWEEKK